MTAVASDPVAVVRAAIGSDALSREDYAAAHAALAALAAELAALRATDERCRRFLAAELDRAATMGAVVRRSAGRTDVAAHAAALEDAATWLRDAMTAGAP